MENRLSPCAWEIYATNKKGPQPAGFYISKISINAADVRRLIGQAVLKEWRVYNVRILINL